MAALGNCALHLRVRVGNGAAAAPAPLHRLMSRAAQVAAAEPSGGSRDARAEGPDSAG